MPLLTEGGRNYIHAHTHWHTRNTHTHTHIGRLNFVTCSVLVVAISDTEVLSSNQALAISPTGHPYGQVETMQGHIQS